MYMQINTSSEKIHKLTSLKFEVLNVSRKTIKCHTITIFYTKCERIVLFIYVTTIYLDFLHLYFSECRWRVCLWRCVRCNMLLIGGSIPAMANVLFFVLIFFSLHDFP
jgi:hypothetical protein